MNENGVTRNEGDKAIRIFFTALILVGLILLLTASGIIIYKSIRYAEITGSQIGFGIFSCGQTTGSFNFTAPVVLALFGLFIIGIGAYSLISAHKKQDEPAPDPEVEKELEKIQKSEGNYLYHPVFADYLHPERYVIESSTQERYQYFVNISREQGAVERTILNKKVKLSGLLFLIGIVSGFLIGIFGSKLKGSEIGINVLQILCSVGYVGCTLFSVLYFAKTMHSEHHTISDIRRYRKAIGKEILKRDGEESFDAWNRRMERLDAYDEKIKDAE